MALIYVTGGAKSGKSEFAENLLLSLNNGKQKNIYLATSLVFDDEMEVKVALHKERRQEKWITIESYKNFEESLNNINEPSLLEEKYQEEHVLNKDNMLVDCLTNMVSNLIFENEKINWDKPTKKEMKLCDEKVKKEVEKLVQISKNYENVVIVSNELGMGVVPPTPLGRYFREIAGKMNQYVAQNANEVYFVVSGISMKIK